jgi:hypothetical protein
MIVLSSAPAEMKPLWPATREAPPKAFRNASEACIKSRLLLGAPSLNPSGPRGVSTLSGVVIADGMSQTVKRITKSRRMAL